MERDSLEVRLKQLLMENQGHLEIIQKQEVGGQDRVRSFMEENEKLKKQMFAIDKQYRNLEAMLADEKDATLRSKKEVEQFKKRFQEAN